MGSVAHHGQEGREASKESPFVARFSLGGAGLRVAIKDSIDVEGWPTRLGSPAFDDASPATSNAIIVSRLLSAGAVITGKTKLHELAYGVTGVNSHVGTPRNPAFPELIPGGSSSGAAAAVAAGLVDAAIGTDTGGSIRVPAACCGVLGLKPTFGRLPRGGVTPFASSLDCVGPLTRSADTLDRVMAMLDPDWRGGAATKNRIGLLSVGADAAVAEPVARVARALGTRSAPLDLKLFAAADEAGLAIIGVEMVGAFGALLESGKLGLDVQTRLRRAQSIEAGAIVEAERTRLRFADHIDELLEHYDALCLPTLPRLPPRVDEALDALAAIDLTRLARPFNLSGHPAIAIPIGEAQGAPVSLQLVAARGADERLVSLARLVERALAGEGGSNA